MLRQAIARSLLQYIHLAHWCNWVVGKVSLRGKQPFRAGIGVGGSCGSPRGILLLRGKMPFRDDSARMALLKENPTAQRPIKVTLAKNNRGCEPL